MQEDYGSNKLQRFIQPCSVLCAIDSPRIGRTRYPVPLLHTFFFYLTSPILPFPTSLGTLSYYASSSRFEQVGGKSHIIAHSPTGPAPVGIEPKMALNAIWTHWVGTVADGINKVEDGVEAEYSMGRGGGGFDWSRRNAHSLSSLLFFLSTTTTTSFNKSTANSESYLALTWWLVDGDWECSRVGTDGLNN